MIFGERIIELIDNTQTYLCYRANPMVQFMYLGCAVGGFVVYVSRGFPEVPGPFLGEWHKYTGTVLMFSCYFCYYKASTVPPGYVTKENNLMACKRYRYDGLIFKPN